MPILISDIISTFNKDKTYGKKGEAVVIVADHDNVVIVEKIGGERFPVKKDDLKEETD
jgi:regulator of extracellular matrix RemA (YlzA/DUF370 family)